MDIGKISPVDRIINLQKNYKFSDFNNISKCELLVHPTLTIHYLKHFSSLCAFVNFHLAGKLLMSRL